MPGAGLAARTDSALGARSGRAIIARIVVAVALAAVISACGGEARREEAARTERTAIAQAESSVAKVAALPATGLWSEARVLERLVRAGVAPRPIEEAREGPEWMRRRPVVFAAGGGEVWAWVYPDSSARRAVTDALDPATAAPPGKVPPFAAPMIFVMQNNLAAVITGGSGTNQERVALALQAGLPVSDRPE